VTGTGGWIRHLVLLPAADWKPAGRQAGVCRYRSSSTGAAQWCLHRKQTVPRIISAGTGGASMRPAGSTGSGLPA